VMPKGETVEIEPFDLLFREVRLLPSFINPFVHRRAADLVASGTIDVARLITRKVSLADAPAVVMNPPAPGEVKVLVVPESLR
jgi:Threonine dehydrogenase and related Zn-dependent dehydrogenases